MNILWITLESILPANSGGRIGVYKRLEQIAKTESIYLFYPYDKQEELEYVNELQQLCTEVHPYARTENKNYALRHLLRYPYTVGSRCITQMQEDIKECISKNSIDVINVDFPHMCVNLLQLDICLPIVLNEHNIEWKVYQRIAKSKSGLAKIAYKMDSYRLRRYEKKIFKKLKIQKVTFVSDKDMEEMIKENQIRREDCELVPVGADVRVLNVEKEERQSEHSIIFVGKMSYAPNIEAVTWFVNSIFPEILKKFSDCRFYIVGKDPVEEVKKLSNENVIVTGSVDSVEPYYKLASLVVLPLRNGGGVKVKLLEAISYNKPIVSTSTGVEGTLYADGKYIPVTDSAEEFANKCIDALNSQSHNEQPEAYRVFLENYTWESIGQKYLNVLKMAAQQNKNSFEK